MSYKYALDIRISSVRPQVSSASSLSDFQYLYPVFFKVFCLRFTQELATKFITSLSQSHFNPIANYSAHFAMNPNSYSATVCQSGGQRPLAIKVEHDRTGSLELGPFKNMMFSPPLPIKKRKAFIFTWEAYALASEICPDIIATRTYNPWFKCKYVYIARDSKDFCVDPFVLKFSLMEAHTFKCFLNKILNQIKKCDSRFRLIEFFDQEPDRALEKMDWNNKQKFWLRPDRQFFHLTLRITYNVQQTRYVLHLLNRVKPEVSAGNGGWVGAYIMVTGTSAFENLRDFLKDSLKKNESEIPSEPQAG